MEELAADGTGDDPHLVRYDLDWNEYWRAHEICWRAATGRLFLRLVPATGLVAIITGFVLVFLDGPADIAPFFWVFGVGFLGTKAARRWTARRAYRRRSGGTAIEISWGTDGITAREGGSPPRTLPWQDIRVVLLTSEGFLVEGRDGPGIWLPFSGFAEEPEIDRFEAAVRQHEVALLDRSSVG